MKGYVEIAPAQILDAVSNYETKWAKVLADFTVVEKHLKSLVHKKGWFYTETEWERCHRGLGWPSMNYIEAAHPDLVSIFTKKYNRCKGDTGSITALAVECKEGTVLCDQNLAKFVKDYAIS